VTLKEKGEPAPRKRRAENRGKTGATRGGKRVFIFQTGGFSKRRASGKTSAKGKNICRARTKRKNLG